MSRSVSAPASAPSTSVPTQYGSNASELQSFIETSNHAYKLCKERVGNKGARLLQNWSVKQLRNLDIARAKLIATSNPQGTYLARERDERIRSIFETMRTYATGPAHLSITQWVEGTLPRERSDGLALQFFYRYGSPLHGVEDGGWGDHNPQNAARAFGTSARTPEQELQLRRILFRDSPRNSWP